jgi:hypothetical protein
MSAFGVERTSPGSGQTDANDPERPSAVLLRLVNSLFDHLVGNVEQARRDREGERFGGL